MKVTKKQLKELLPFVQEALDATLVRWNAEQAIEDILNREIDNFTSTFGDMAFSHEIGNKLDLKDVQEFVDLLNLEEE